MAVAWTVPLSGVSVRVSVGLACAFAVYLGTVWWWQAWAVADGIFVVRPV